jgi:hypothetical protein
LITERKRKKMTRMLRTRPVAIVYARPSSMTVFSLPMWEKCKCK